jgi:hypothetical protein
MKSDEKLYLKDGTPWDDDKSDEFVDDLLEKMSNAAKEGKLTVGSKQRRATFGQKYKIDNSRRYSVSVKYLPSELQKELAYA